VDNEEIKKAYKETINTARIAENLLSSKGWDIIEQRIELAKKDFLNLILNQEKLDIQFLENNKGKVQALIGLKNYLQSLTDEGNEKKQLLEELDKRS